MQSYKRVHINHPLWIYFSARFKMWQSSGLHLSIGHWWWTWNGIYWSLEHDQVSSWVPKKSLLFLALEFRFPSCLLSNSWCFVVLRFIHCLFDQMVAHAHTHLLLLLVCVVTALHMHLSWNYLWSKDKYHRGHTYYIFKRLFFSLNIII